MWADFVQNELLPSLIALLGALVTVATGMAVAAIRNWGKQQKAAWVAQLMEAVTAAAQTAVLRTNQVFVDDLRAHSRDGKLDWGDAKQAMSAAKTVLIEQLGAELWQAFIKLMGGFEPAEAALEAVIEAQVSVAKKDKARAAVASG